MSKQLLRQSIEEKQGYFGAKWLAAWPRLDAGFLNVWQLLTGIPLRKNLLEKAFVAPSVCAASMHLWLPGVKRHIEVAIKYGATGEDWKCRRKGASQRPSRGRSMNGKIR